MEHVLLPTKVGLTSLFKEQQHTQITSSKQLQCIILPQGIYIFNGSFRRFNNLPRGKLLTRAENMVKYF
jgi:hypothetical protein